MSVLDTVAGGVRFAGLFIAYVAVLTAMGIARAGRASYRLTLGRAVDSPPSPDVDESAGDPFPGTDSPIDDEDVTTPTYRT